MESGHESTGTAPPSSMAPQGIALPVSTYKRMGNSLVRAHVQPAVAVYRQFESLRPPLEPSVLARPVPRSWIRSETASSHRGLGHPLPEASSKTTPTAMENLPHKSIKPSREPRLQPVAASSLLKAGSIKGSDSVNRRAVSPESRSFREPSVATYSRNTTLQPHRSVAVQPPPKATQLTSQNSSLTSMSDAKPPHPSLTLSSSKESGLRSARTSRAHFALIESAAAGGGQTGSQLDKVEAFQQIPLHQYVRSSPNQLVVAANSDVRKSPPPMGTGLAGEYAKTRANQLVRTGLRSSSASPSVSPVMAPHQNLSSVPLLALPAANMSLPNTDPRGQHKLSRGHSRKAFNLKRSKVWTLGGTPRSPARMSGSSIWGASATSPAFLSWKRSITLRKHRQIGRWGRTLPILRRGLPLAVLSRAWKECQIEPLYSRRGSGFTLQRTGVRSLAGGNLKWTESLKEHAKKASQEATKAVAAAEKTRREKANTSVTARALKLWQKKAAHLRRPLIVRRLPPKERIVRVGSSLYQADQSGRTLRRLPGAPRKATSPATTPLSKLSGSPLPSSGGSALYFRVGGGNKLVRDARIFARSPVSRSRSGPQALRFRRTRVLRHCQFYTRFGKCTRPAGLCPYLHDPGQVAVCRKFLQGSCDNPSCLLTHKVIPERMQDCSFFQQGLCANESCPYRHVRVNPQAPHCRDFQRGCCPLGDECNRKHTYECPDFSEGGGCPRGAECKMVHPRGKKGDEQESQENAKRRYFDAFLTAEEGMVESATQRKQRDVRTAGWNKDSSDNAALGLDLGEGGIPLLASSEKTMTGGDQESLLVRESIGSEHGPEGVPPGLSEDAGGRLEVAVEEDVDAMNSATVASDEADWEEVEDDFIGLSGDEWEEELLEPPGLAGGRYIKQDARAVLSRKKRPRGMVLRKLKGRGTPIGRTVIIGRDGMRRARKRRRQVAAQAETTEEPQILPSFLLSRMGLVQTPQLP